ncbi:MAG: DNA polymerase III subunit delta' [Labrys sp. (in: a-proteobacteria)]
MSEAPESDRLEDAPHPRETTRLIGQEAAENAFLEAYLSGRAHHAWIIGGPEGIGKATLTYRIAKFVFDNPDPARAAGASSLAVTADRPAVRLIEAQSHPDLFVLRRAWNSERKTHFSNIRVDDVRRIGAFFGSTAAYGGWRITIVDAAEDLAREGANSLLKVLEEPPERALFLIVSHQPGRLLPTIRSRCRRLTLSTLTEDEVSEAAALARPDIDRAVLREAARLADGSVRLTLSLAGGEGIAVHKALTDLLARLPAVDVGLAHQFADRMSGRAGDEAFSLFRAFLDDWLHQRVVLEAGSHPAHRLARWAEVWEKARDAARDVEVFNLDRKPYVLATLSMLAAASR